MVGSISRPTCPESVASATRAIATPVPASSSCARDGISPCPTCLTRLPSMPGHPRALTSLAPVCDLHLGVSTRLLGMGPLRGLRRAGLSDSRARSEHGRAGNVLLRCSFPAQTKTFASHWSRRRRLDCCAEGRELPSLKYRGYRSRGFMNEELAAVTAGETSSGAAEEGGRSPDANAN